ncbi:unnamed protein product [Paramecium pentaurelia]|uniref:RING-type domain-containing protein n=1 Tax=Paramecium pentaurelia TaxID=43138 RepID=A0A8S1VEP4_9CILI|nr:unnamed protein product [Paramecium pentaurelia]
MLVISLIPINIRSQYQKLDKLIYWQNLGNNLNFAIFCSIIHYFLNQKNYQPIQKFLNISQNSLSEDSHQLQQLIIQSLEEKNPILHFFRSLQQIDNYVDKIEKLLIQLCRIHFLIKNQKPYLNSIAIFLQIEINFLQNNEKLGRGQELILLSKSNDDFYFIIPLQQIQKLPLYKCVQCKQDQHCINMNCKHQICLNCIQTNKQNSEEDYFFCKCGQIIIKNKFLEDAIQETQNLQIIYAHHLLITEYYEQITEKDQMKIEYEKVEQKYQRQVYPQEIINSSNTLKQKFPERFQQINFQQRLLKSECDTFENQQNINFLYSTQSQERVNKTFQPYSIQTQNHFSEGISRNFDLMSHQDELQSQPFQDSSRITQQQQCSYCNSPFDEFNLQQDINCISHVIGACCVMGDYNNCPQCEKIKEIWHQLKKKFKPEKISSLNQPTIYYEKQLPNSKKLIQSTPIVSSYNIRVPTMKEFYGPQSYERQNNNQSFQQNRLANKEFP